MHVAQVTLKPSSFLLVQAVNIYDQLKKKQNLHGELFQPHVKLADSYWNDWTCKISQSNSKCKHILTLRIPTIYIPARELQKEAFLNYQKLLLPGLNAQLTLLLITVPSKIQNTLLLSSIKESLHWGWAGWIRAGRVGVLKQSLQAQTPGQVMLASPLCLLGSGLYERSEGCHAASLLLFVCSGLQDAECWEGSWEYDRPSQHGWFSSLGMPTAHKRRCRSNRSVLEKLCVTEDRVSLSFILTREDMQLKWICSYGDALNELIHWTTLLLFVTYFCNHLVFEYMNYIVYLM